MGDGIDKAAAITSCLERVDRSNKDGLQLHPSDATELCSDVHNKEEADARVGCAEGLAKKTNPDGPGFGKMGAVEQCKYMQTPQEADAYVYCSENVGDKVKADDVFGFYKQSMCFGVLSREQVDARFKIWEAVGKYAQPAQVGVRYATSVLTMDMADEIVDCIDGLESTIRLGLYESINVCTGLDILDSKREYEDDDF